MPIYNYTAGECNRIMQCVHVLTSLIHELQTLHMVQKHTVDDITDRIVELEKALISLQLAVHNTNTDLENEQTKKNKIAALNIGKRKLKQERFLTECVDRDYLFCLYPYI